MNIEETIKQFEKDVGTKINNPKLRPGVIYALNMINKHLKYKEDCWFYGTDNWSCKQCSYICDRYQSRDSQMKEDKLCSCVDSDYKKSNSLW